MRRYIAFLTSLLLIVLGAIGWNSVRDNATSPNSESSATAVPGLDAPNLEKFYVQVLDWKSCESDFECASFEVPIDYANPDAGSMDIAVTRLVGANSQGKALVLNPGGPGGSGIEYAQAAQYVMSESLIKNFDVVGFDPRGVGQSSPIDCLNDEETDAYIAADGSPDDQQEIDATVQLLKDFAQACSQLSPTTFGFIDTVSAAKDIDILRVLLKNTELNWFGKSYGTFLGATYAELFPKNVGRMMLDGAIDPSMSNAELSHGQALGFENALNRFVADCPSHDNCPLQSEGQAGVNEIMNFINSFDSTPVTLDDGRVLTQAMALTGVLGPLYDKQYGWESLRTSLADAFDADYAALVDNVDWYTSRNDDGTYSDNSNDAIMAINCLDRQDRPTLEESQALAEAWAVEAPNFGAYLGWGNLSCSYWNAPATGTAHAIAAAGAPTILVVGTTNDPATPYAWSQALASQLSSGVLLTLDGDGHTAYFQGSSCIDDYVDNYFLSGEAPKGVTCNDGP